SQSLAAGRDPIGKIDFVGCPRPGRRVARATRGRASKSRGGPEEPAAVRPVECRPPPCIRLGKRADTPYLRYAEGRRRIPSSAALTTRLPGVLAGGPAAILDQPQACANLAARRGRSQRLISQGTAMSENPASSNERPCLHCLIGDLIDE